MLKTRMRTQTSHQQHQQTVTGQKRQRLRRRELIDEIQIRVDSLPRNYIYPLTADQLRRYLYSLPTSVRRLRHLKFIELRGPKAPGFHSCFAYSQWVKGKIVLFAIPKTRHFTWTGRGVPMELLRWEQFFERRGWALRDHEGWHFGWKSDKDLKSFFRYVFIHELGHLLQSKSRTAERSTEIFARRYLNSAGRVT